MGKCRDHRDRTGPAAGNLNRALTALTNGALTFAGVGVFARAVLPVRVLHLRGGRVRVLGLAAGGGSASARWCW